MAAPANDEWFLAAELEFSAADPEAAGEVRRLAQRRKLSQPLGEWSCGSVFTNPPGDHAARLIEAAGLKGFRIGGAVVSDKHANFILNEGQASARDLEHLIEHVRSTVRRVHGVRAGARSAHCRGDGLMHLSYDASQLRRVKTAGEFGRVAVLLGGGSTEREVSLMSGKDVLAALRARGVDAHGFDPSERDLMELRSGRFRARLDRAARPGRRGRHRPGCARVPRHSLHRKRGDSVRRSPWTSSAPSAWPRRSGCRRPSSWCCASDADLAVALKRLKLPMIVKPASQGSSVGMTRVEKAKDLPAAWRAATAHEPVAFAEPWITGAEYTVSMLQGKALPSIRIETPRAFYDYEAKYLRSDTVKTCPSGLNVKAERQLAQLSLAAFEACAAEGWGRADFMMAKGGRPLLLEVNTVPGMTDHSLVPMAAGVAGIDFERTGVAHSRNQPGAHAMLGRARNVRRERRAEQSERWQFSDWPWRRIGAIGAALLGVGALAAALLLFMNQPIERIRVDGQFQHLAAQDVEKAVRAQLHGAGLVSVRLDDVRRALRLLPWVASATVQRSWPRGLTVTVIEQQAVARWNSTDLVNVHGDLFHPTPASCRPSSRSWPVPPAPKRTWWQRYLALQGKIEESGVELSALRLDARGAWDLQLDNGVAVRFGRRQVDERFQRFLSVALRLICSARRRHCLRRHALHQWICDRLAERCHARTAAQPRTGR